jgi:hypothetical protein
MMLVQTSRAKQFRKYQVLMLALLLITGSFGVLLTMHWFTAPRQ